MNHFAELCNRFDRVIYVLGNHEYYGSTPATAENKIKEIESNLQPKLTVLRLENPTVTINNQRFIGGTMWFPDRVEAHIYKSTINDSIQIKEFYPWVFSQSNQFLTYLKTNILSTDIIITHHIPTDIDTKSIWKKSPTQAFFLNKDAESYLQDPTTVKPKAWIYGHTHDKHDFQVGNTRFICRPSGYPGENPNWMQENYEFYL